MHPQTKRQREVLEIISRFIKNRGFKPSYQQIARELGVTSKGGIARHIAALEQLGCVTRRRENGIFKLELRTENVLNEFICEIAWLDVPKDEDLAEDWEYEPLFVPRFLIGSHEDDLMRAYRVVDDAMLDKHICPGDVALIERRSYARDGDTVVAIAGVKTILFREYYRAGAKIELHSANPQFETIILPADRVKIMGVLQSILRPVS
ncbi:hypothetical protein BH10ACI1_BH10ACI1_24480 [soil metagenome]